MCHLFNGSGIPIIHHIYTMYKYSLKEKTYS